MIDHNWLDMAQFLHRTGHFWRPDCPDCHNITPDDLPKLGIGHRLMRESIASFQSFDANFEIGALRQHKRSVIPDGDVGPVTLGMEQRSRCPVPDWAPPENAALPKFSDDPEVNQHLVDITESMRATGSGSWPIPGCNPDRPNRANEHSTRVHVDTSRATASQKRTMVEECALVAAAEAEMGQHVEHIFDSGEDPSTVAEHDVRYQPIPGGTIGFAYFPQPGTCRQTMKCRLDTAYDRDKFANARLKQHEYKGHSDGLRHTRGGVMNPSLLDLGPRITWIGDPHESTKRRYFGGEPIVDDPPGPPVPELKIVKGEFAVFAFDQLVRLKVAPESVETSSINPGSISIVDGKIDFEVSGRRVRLLVIERADF